MTVTKNNAPEMDTQSSPRPTLVKREKIFGERIFDFGVYGGFATVLNEVLGTLFTGMTTKEPWLAPFNKLRTLTEKLPVVGKFPYVTSGRLSYILVSFIGGTIAVLPVVVAERFKGPIVRWIDHLHYGKQKSDTDPNIIEAHKEMDEAPPQTLRSVIDGRLVTMGMAIAVDTTICGPNALSCQLVEKTRLKDTWVNKFSSFERACITSARSLVNWADTKGAAGRLAAQSAEKPFVIQPGEGKWTDWLGRGSSLMTLSTLLTLIFYASSKYFANRIALNKEEKRDAVGVGKYGDKVYSADVVPEQPAEKSTESPSTRIREAVLSERPREAMVRV